MLKTAVGAISKSREASVVMKGTMSVNKAAEAYSSSIYSLLLSPSVTDSLIICLISKVPQFQVFQDYLNL